MLTEENALPRAKDLVAGARRQRRTKAAYNHAAQAAWVCVARMGAKPAGAPVQLCRDRASDWNGSCRWSVSKVNVMAQSFDFGEIIGLLNHSKNIAIASGPVVEQPGRWSLHRGRYTVHTSITEFEVLYIGSSATQADIDEAARYYKEGSTQVVYANSLDRHARKYHHKRLGRSPERFWSTRDYLKSFIRDELDAYLAQLTKLKPRFYTEPQVETPLGVTGRRPNRLLSFLRSPRFEAETAEGLTVLLGEPGQGKTVYESTSCLHSCRVF